MSVHVIRLEGGKGNSIDDAFLDRLERAIESVEQAGGAGVIVGSERFFSAGLSLPALYARDRDGMRAFMRHFDAVMRRVFLCPRPIVAAINGHAIAGGCILALQCDVRIAAAGDAKLGLNEAAIGVGLPALVIETLRAQVPPRSVAEIAREGRLFSPQRALELGLVDEVVPPDSLEERATARAAELAQVPAAAYAHIKRSLRAPVLELIARNDDADGEKWLDTWFSPPARERIGAAVQRLR